MSGLPSYLSSGASSRAHHAFLVKLHRAQSEQEEHEVIGHEVQRAKRELAVKGGASLSTMIETLIILLHCTVQQHRAGKFEDEADEADGGPLSSSKTTAGDGSREEDWALMAALQVVERAKDVRDKRIGYLYLSERLPQGHELRLMLINTIRKDLESKRISHILLALGTIIKQPSADLAPAVTPILISKAFFKHHEPAIRQRTLQSLMALHLSLRPSDTAMTDAFPLSMSKIVRLIISEQDLGVLCVLLGMLRGILEAQTHRIQGMQERIYLVQQISLRLGEMQPEYQVAVQAVRALRPVLEAPVRPQTQEGDDEGKRLAAEELDEVLERMVSKVDDCTGLGGALVLEICSLFNIRSDPDVQLPKAFRRCLKLLSGVLCPTSSSSQSTLPPANDHIFVLRCLAKIPLARWETEFGAMEMGTIMRGLESGDDSVRKATLRLLRTSAPEVFDQTLKNYLISLQSRSDLALPLHIPAEADQAKKLQLALRETASRALVVVFIRSRGEGEGGAAADGVHAVLEAMRGVETDSAGGGTKDDVVWEDGLREIMDFFQSQTSEYRSDFTQNLISHPTIRNATFLALRASVVYSHLSSGSEGGSDLCTRLVEDLAVAEGSDLQESVLAALVWAAALTHVEKGETSHQVQDTLRGLMRDKKMSKRTRTRIDRILDMMSAGLLLDVKTSIGDSHQPDEILTAAEAVWKRYHPDSEHVDPSSSAHTILAESGALSPRPADGGVVSALRYGAYDAPQPASPRTASRSRRS